MILGIVQEKGKSLESTKRRKYEMSSKKKRRHQEYLKRQKKRDIEASKQQIINNPNSTMEEVATAMGIELK